MAAGGCAAGVREVGSVVAAVVAVAVVVVAVAAVAVVVEGGRLCASWGVAAALLPCLLQ